MGLLKYPYIQAWGEMLGSYQFYIDGEIARAEADGAPYNATHRDGNTGEWRTADDIGFPDTRERIERTVKRRLGAAIYKEAKAKMDKSVGVYWRHELVGEIALLILSEQFDGITNAEKAAEAAITVYEDGKDIVWSYDSSVFDEIIAYVKKREAAQ